MGSGSVTRACPPPGPNVLNEEFAAESEILEPGPGVYALGLEREE